MKNAADRLFHAIQKVNNPTAMGLDTQVSHLPAEFKPQDSSRPAACSAILRYNCALLSGLEDLVRVVKVQMAYYELFGLDGMAAFAETLCFAKKLGYIVIVDGKRNDIGSTAEAYAAAYLGGSGDFACDFLTVNPYLGSDGIEPFLRQAKENGCGIFALVKTSNPSSGELQDRILQDGRRVYELMGEMVAGWGADQIGESGFSAVGAVVGATWPAELASLRERMPRTPLLVPGYGAQGAGAAQLRGCFDRTGTGAVINASRSILCAHQKAPSLPWLEATRAEVIRMRDDINGIFQERKLD